MMLQDIPGQEIGRRHKQQYQKAQQIWLFHGVWSP
jgi:hypothetical protein